MEMSKAFRLAFTAIAVAAFPAAASAQWASPSVTVIVNPGYGAYDYGYGGYGYGYGAPVYAPAAPVYAPVYAAPVYPVYPAPYSYGYAGPAYGYARWGW